jgi:hypothetical protein
VKKKDPKFEKWKKEVKKEVMETVITDRVKFSEYLEQVLDLAYMHGLETGSRESLEAIRKKLTG